MLEDVSIALGISIGVEQIESVLGIIILCIQIAWILGKFGYSVYKKIKEKKYSEIKQDVDQVTEELTNVTKKEK